MADDPTPPLPPVTAWFQRAVGDIHDRIAAIEAYLMQLQAQAAPMVARVEADIPKVEADAPVIEKDIKTGLDEVEKDIKDL